MEKYLFKEETYQIIGRCMEVQKTLGYGFSEIVYKDAIEIEFLETKLPHLREAELNIFYKEKKLKRRFYTDFLCFDRIIVEIKSSADGIINDHIAQTLNYLRASGNEIGLNVNFGKLKLEYKRLIFSLPYHADISA